ncbi:hypothetical protein OCS_04289 [Ophiocordyceps sinensis CO18]|uniref:Uncharacterized protein n=1 Tax=Ophiocordyceps sinensis (strain Co18 / CGMCC 3.14243) TaxID=911162 RepID=T5AE32_OPHSC|nr:hypothetical protein OCS_04289 [Ophiocordyceps sinensis CO18]
MPFPTLTIIHIRTHTHTVLTSSTLGPSHPTLSTLSVPSHFIDFRLYRLGQTEPVIWHGLQVTNSFHDHQERLCLIKYARQLSVEMVLADWIPADLIAAATADKQAVWTKTSTHLINMVLL